MSRSRYRFCEDHYPHFMTATVVAWLPVFSRPEFAEIVFKLRHKVDQTYQLWQEGSHPQVIETDEVMWQKIEYIHENPERRGFVDDPLHWRYSSARCYAGQQGLLDVCTDWR